MNTSIYVTRPIISIYMFKLIYKLEFIYRLSFIYKLSFIYSLNPYSDTNLYEPDLSIACIYMDLVHREHKYIWTRPIHSMYIYVIELIYSLVLYISLAHREHKYIYMFGLIYNLVHTHLCHS